MKTIYVDNNATTPVAPEVYEAMIPFFKDNYFNPSSMYDQAKEVEQKLSQARNVIAEHLGISGTKDPGASGAAQLLFTSCATESNNMAILGTSKAIPGKHHIITSAVEHPAVLEVCKELEKNGYKITFVPIDGSGKLDIATFVRSLNPETFLVTIMHANNETGVIFPIEELSRLTKETDPSIVFHTDATQSAGKIPINLEKEFKNVDLLSFSGHKLHAPKGIGALFVRKGTPCRPFMLGGHQEKGRRAGTENVPYIIGLAKAVELSFANLEEDEKRIKKMRDRLENFIEENITYVQVNGKGAPRLPNTSNISCHYIEGEGILFQLNSEGICASSGSACTSGTLDPSHVLKAMGIPFTALHGSIRFSLSRYNTEEEINRIIKVFPEIVANLRRISPYWDNKTNKPVK